jgi:DNA-binding response OmpR family regulator
MKLLIADDDTVSLNILSRILTKWGYEVVTAVDGESAWRVLREPDAPRIVILDWMMPGLTGPEVCRKVRGLEPVDPPYLIILTARGATRDIVEGLSAGANDFISKPVEIEELRARIDAGQRTITLQDSLSRRAAELTKAEESIIQINELSRGGWKQLQDWTVRTTAEVALAIGSRGMGALAATPDEVMLLAPLPHFEVPTPEFVFGLREPVEEEIQGSTVSFVPAKGENLSLCGCLVLPLRFSTLTRGERKLVESFARHLSTALEFEGMRRQVQTLERRRLEAPKLKVADGAEPALICPRCDRCYADGTARCENDSAELGLPSGFPFRIGGRYRLTRYLGEGGMGSVFAADDERLSRPVAIKIIKPELVNNAEMRMRIEREARLIAQLQHPSIVAIFDSGELPDTAPFLVMELLRGRDLAFILERMGPGTPRQVASVLKQTAAALELAHKRGIVHRDLNPANLFLTAGDEEFRVKVLDFGLARSIRDDLRTTRSGFLVGSPAYMSPEQVREEPPTPASDLFSLASVCLELLTGRCAFQESSTIGTLNAIMFGRPASVLDIIPDAPDELEILMLEAFQKTPRERPASVREWVERVAPILNRTRSRFSGWDLGALFKEREPEQPE